MLWTIIIMSAYLVIVGIVAGIITAMNTNPKDKGDMKMILTEFLEPIRNIRRNKIMEYTYNYNDYYFGQVSCIDRQIAELEARKYALQHGYCFTGYYDTKPYLDPYGLDKEEPYGRQHSN